MRRKQHSLSGLLAAFMFVAAMMLPASVWAQSVTTEQPTAGDGTSANPYQIANAAQLAWFRDWVNGTYTPAGGGKGTKHETACAKLTADIDMRSVCSETIGSWKPIGNWDLYVIWYGTFDGDGHTLSNLYVNRTTEYVGMFGYTTGCTIKNITFSGVNITGTEDYTGIIGYMINGSVTNVTVTDGVITGESVVGGICAKTDGTISHCTNHAQVTGSYGVGGICGKSDGTIEYCTNYGAVTGTGNYNSSIGGIVGGAQNGGSISHCANYGNVEGDSEVGGILGSGGYGTFSLANVISTGNVTETSSDDTAGMVVGCVQGQLTLSDFAVFNSEATLTLNGTAQTARGIGKIDSSAFYNGSVSGETAGYTTAQLRSGMVTYLLQSAAPDGTWGQQLGTNAYPLLGSAHTVYAAGDIAITCAGSISGGSFSNTRPAVEATVTFSHGTITHHAAVEKTCTSDGNVEYWHCESCEKDYTDDELTVETDDPVLHATGHNYDYAEGSCTVCSEVIPSITEGTHTIQIAAVSGDELEIDGYNLYRFVAPGDGDLTVKTTGSEETYGSLWSSDGTTRLTMDYGHGEGGNFQFTYAVTKGTVYYIGVREYHGLAIDGDYTITLSGTWPDMVPLGDGTSANPYQIANAAQLAWFRDWVNGTYTPAAGETATKHASACAKLTADIDMSSVCSEDIGSWEPISRKDLNVNWNGIFDGDGHTLSNLYVNMTTRGAGMFGYVSDCTIKNITFSGVNITGTNYETGIIGALYYSNGSVTNVTVTDGVITGKYNVGGICGYSNSSNTISHCTNYGAVQSSYYGVGGIVGRQQGGSISHCANYGNIEGTEYVGGITGWITTASSITNVISTGNVTKTNNNRTAGLVVGCVQGQLTLSDFAVFNSDATLTLNGTAQTALGIGYIDSGNGGSVSDEPAGYTTAQLQSGMVTYLLQSVAPEGTWGQQLGTDDYPLLGSAHTVYPEGDITITCTGSFSGGSFSNTQPATEGSVTFSHGTITHHAAVEKTCTSDGNVEYWHCESCDKDYSDAALTTVIADLVIPCTGHNYDYTAGSCTVCGEVIPIITEGTHTIQITAVIGSRTQINGYNLFRFVAPGDGELTVTATGSEDTYGSLWSGDGTTLLKEDDETGEGNNFQITYAVTKGTVYYIGVRRYSGSAISGDYTITLSGTWPEMVTLADGEAYTTARNAPNFTYTRTFAHTHWQPLYVPFAMKSADWMAQGLEVACINNFHEYEQANGSTKVVLEVKKVTTGMLRPNTPYLIRAIEAGDKIITLSNVELAAPANNTIDCASVTRTYTFTGIYAEKSDFDANDYTMTDGDLYHPAGALKPQRWYLSVAPRDAIIDNEPGSASPRVISVSVIGEGEATGIDEIGIISHTTASGHSGLYDLQGRRLNHEPAHGIYIHNGRKVVR